MTYTPILNNPTEYNQPEPERCQSCDNDILTAEEIEERQCFECIEELEKKIKKIKILKTCKIINLKP